MRVFVTGASGFIGSNVSGALARAGHEVLGLVRTSSKARALAAQGIEPLVGDMALPVAWRARAAECEVRIHCAAEYSERYRALDRATTAELLGLPAPRGTTPLVIYTSGVWIYGDTGGRIVDEHTPLSPSAFVLPRSEVEALVLGADGPKLRTLVLRPGCVYGGGGSLTAGWFESAVKEQAAAFVGSGAQRWAMVHVSDLARLYLLSAESGLHGEVFNAVDASNASVCECAEAASRAAGAAGKTLSVPVEEARKLYGPMADCLCYDQLVNSDKAASMLAWKPKQRTFVEQAQTLFRSWQATSAG
jgi:nucleoside-diphosphate-sugar epimerase